MSHSIESREVHTKGKMKWLALIPAIIVATLLFILISMNTRRHELPKSDTQDASVSESRVPANKALVLRESLKVPELIEKRLKEFPPHWQDMFKEYLDLTFVENLEKCKTLEDTVILLSEHVDPSFSEIEFKNWLNACVEEILDPQRSTWGGKTFNQLSAGDRLCALASFLIRDQNFKYGDEVTPDLYLMSNVIKRREGYCATLPVVYALICERLKMPVHIVQGAQHLFNRYDDGKVRLNIETTNPVAMGVGTPDEVYLNDEGNGLLIPNIFLKTTTTMKSMNLRQTISALLVNSAAALNEKADFKGFINSPFPKSEEKVIESAKYMLTSLYFDRNNVLPITNTLTILEKKSELIHNDSFYSSLRAYAIRKGIRKASQQDINNMYSKMESFLSKFKDFNSLVMEYKAVSFMNSKRDQHDGGIRESLLFDIRTISDTNTQHIKGFLEANKYILPREIEKALSSVKRSYGKIRKQIEESL